MASSQLPVRSLLTAGLSLVAGGATVWLASRLYQQGRAKATATYTDLRRPYFWCCVAFALGIVAVGLAQTQVGREATLLFGLLFAVFPPWAVFALNFVGRGQLLTRRRIFAIVLYSTLFVLYAAASVTGIVPRPANSSSLLALFTSVFALLLIAGLFTLGGLVLLSTYRHRNLSIMHGVVAILPMVFLIFSVQLPRPFAPVLNDVIVSTVSLGVSGSLLVATTRYDILKSRPGTGTAGEQAAVREMDEAIVTVERDGTLARANTTAKELFGSQLQDSTLPDVVGYDPPELADRETIEIWTEDGRKQFDPRVTELVNGYDEVFGYTVNLIDVTDREIRRQRIEVLNRILRHNIRNSLDVIKADAELVADEDRATSILDTTDTLNRLSADARRIESLLRRSADERVMAGLTTVAESVTEDVADDHLAASVSVDIPDMSVDVDAQLCRFAIRNVVENAIVHNDGAEPRVEVRGTETETSARVVVADDGPGIPDSERSVIERQSESPQSHASSLGLWGTNWAIQQMGGELSFRESDLGGTTVVIELPAN